MKNILQESLYFIPLVLFALAICLVAYFFSLAPDQKLIPPKVVPKYQVQEPVEVDTHKYDNYPGKD